MKLYDEAADGSIRMNRSMISTSGFLVQHSVKREGELIMEWSFFVETPLLWSRQIPSTCGQPNPAEI